MDFSLSTFTIEVNGMPAVVFQAKWHHDADDICKGWAEYHRDQLLTKGWYGLDYPPTIKVRVARVPERAAYADGAEVEYYSGTKLVYLRNLAEI